MHRHGMDTVPGLPRWLVLVAVILAIGGFGGLLLGDLLISRQQDFDHAIQESHNLGRLIERDIAGTVAKIDVVLSETVNDFTPFVTTGGPVDLLRLNQDLGRRMVMIPETQENSLRVINQHGRVVFNAGKGTALPDVVVSDRAYFLHQKNHPAAGLVLSESLLSRFTGKWLITLSRRISGPDGSFAGVAQAALRTEYFQSLFESVDVGEQGTISLFDDQFRLLARHAAIPELLGKSFDLAEVRQGLEDGRQIGDYLIRSRVDGVLRSHTYRKLKGLPYILVIGRSPDDILSGWRRKALVYGAGFALFTLALMGVLVQIQRRSEQQHQLVAQVFEHSLDGIAITDPRGRILFANPAFLETVGLHLDQAKSAPLLDLVAGNHGGVFRADVWAQLAAHGAWRGEVCGLRPDGTPCVQWMSLGSLKGHGGRVVNHLAIFADVSQLKAVEETLRRTVERLDRSNAELERVTYVAAHDLREPLRIVTSYAQLISRQIAGQVDAQVDHNLQMMVGAAKRMYALIGDLLAYSRINANAAPLSLVDSAEACGMALQNLGLSISQSGARISLDHLPRVLGDRVQMMQLFQNLIGNAITFASPGVRPEIQVRTSLSEGMWCFAVADNGVGIDPKVNDAFELFRRLHSGRKAGTGVGLAICKRIVERVDGRIWHEPNPTGGTIFYFTVPDGADGSELQPPPSAL